jgi:hypothetical protein
VTELLVTPAEEPLPLLELLALCPQAAIAAAKPAATNATLSPRTDLRSDTIFSPPAGLDMSVAKARRFDFG